MASAISLLLLGGVGRGCLGVSRVVAMRSGMLLRRFFGMVLGLNMVAMRQMGMVGGLLVIALFVVLSGVFMVLRSVLMVLRGVAMMIGVFLRHGKSSLMEIGNLLGFYSANSIGAPNYKEIAGELQRSFAYKSAPGPRLRGQSG